MPPDHGGAREVAGGCGVVLAEVVGVGAAVGLRPPALPQPQLRPGVQQEERCGTLKKFVTQPRIHNC